MYRTRSTATQRSSLEVFILALISQGNRTTYDLQTAAGLSLGATVPALTRLSDAKMVTKRIEGRRHEFSLTKAGQKVLRDWTIPSRPVGEYDDLLRTAYLCVFLKRDKATAADVLSQAARARKRAAEDRQDEIGSSKIDPVRIDADAYLWMRMVSDRHRLEAEAHALAAIAAEFQTKQRARR